MTGAKINETESTKPNVQRFRSPLNLTLALFWAWQFLFWSGLQDSVELSPFLLFCGSVASALPVLVPVFNESVTRTMLSSGALVVAVGILGCAGSLGTALLAKWFLILPCVVCQGLSSGFFCLIAIDFCASNRGAQVVRAFSTTMLVGFIAAAVAIAISSGRPGLVSSVFPLAIVAVYARMVGSESVANAPASEPFIPVGKPDGLPVLVFPIAYVAFAALGFGFTTGIEAVPPERAGLFEIGSLLSRGIALATVVFFYVVSNKRFNLPLTMGVVLLVAGILSVAEGFLVPHLMAPGILLAQCGYTFCEIATFAILAEVAALAKSRRMGMVACK